MRHSAPQGRFKRLAAIGAAAVLSTFMISAPAQADPADIPGVDEIRSSPNINLIANEPKTGPFAPENALNSDLAFQGKYAYAGNYNGFTVYDISNPASPRFVDYVNMRDFTQPVDGPLAGDLGPEGLLFIPAGASPNGKPLLVIGNEISGTTTLLQIDPEPGVRH